MGSGWLRVIRVPLWDGQGINRTIYCIQWAYVVNCIGRHFEGLTGRST